MLHIRADRCVGWHCLTPAQKFGIIFTIVAVTVFLTLAWMCYLGRTTSIHRIRQSQPLPGGRWAPRNSNLPPNIALGQLPVVQQWPGYPPQVFYQPVVYNLDPQQGPQASPYLIAGPYHQQAMGAVGHGHLTSPPVQLQPPFPSPTLPLPSNNTAIHPPITQDWYPRGPQEGGSHSHPGSQLHRERPMTWKQRLDRIFSLPVGRASTIASSETPRRSTSHSTRASSSGRQRGAKNRRGNVHNNPVMRLESPTRPGVPKPPGPHRSHERRRDADDDVRSVETTLATVHSDDYDPPVEQPHDLSARFSQSLGQDTPLPSSCQVVPRADDVSIGSNTTGGDELDIIPSVSSASLEGAPSSAGVIPIQSGCKAPRMPKESDLGTQSSISMKKPLLN